MAGVMGFLYFDLQLDPLLGSPVVFRLSHIRYPAPTILRKCTMNKMQCCLSPFNFKGDVQFVLALHPKIKQNNANAMSFGGSQIQGD